ncbi:MAG: endonuclease domain-containing protein [Gemmatimonadales bacterium]
MNKHPGGRVRIAIRKRPYAPHDVDHARPLRHDPTGSESTAWRLLRSRRMLGLKFRRQQPMRGFILDFYCAEHRLAVEIDGGILGSDEQQAWDADRSAALARSAITVVRVRNEDVSAARLEELIRRSVSAPLSRRERGRG